MPNGLLTQSFFKQPRTSHLQRQIDVIDTMTDSQLQATARARLDQVAGGKVPYNAVAGGSVGPGGSGKTQTHRSVMGEPFDEVRHSTVAVDKMVLEVRQTTTKTLNFQRVETSSLMERAVHTAATDKTAASQTISRLVATNAGRAEVRGRRCETLDGALFMSVGFRCKHWRMCCMPMRLTCGFKTLEWLPPNHLDASVTKLVCVFFDTISSSSLTGIAAGPLRVAEVVPQPKATPAARHAVHRPAQASFSRSTRFTTSKASVTPSTRRSVHRPAQDTHLLKMTQEILTSRRPYIPSCLSNQSARLLCRR
jgi:hypothetical protein